MKKTIIALTCTLALLPGLALANEEASPQDKMAQQCLTFGLEKIKTSNHALHTKLKATRPDSEVTSIEKYDEKIGSQHIATLLTTDLDTKDDSVSEMMCLLENDKPLFVHFYNVSE